MHTITNKDLGTLIEAASKEGVDFDVIEGTLADNVLIYNDNRYLRVHGELRKYIAVIEKPVNEWTSELVLIQSDEVPEEWVERENEMEAR